MMQTIQGDVVRLLQLGALVLPLMSAGFDGLVENRLPRSLCVSPLIRRQIVASRNAQVARRDSDPAVGRAANASGRWDGRMAFWTSESTPA
jgi:hypothetical protein